MDNLWDDSRFLFYFTNWHYVVLCAYFALSTWHTVLYVVSGKKGIVGITPQRKFAHEFLFATTTTLRE